MKREPALERPLFAEGADCSDADKADVGNATLPDAFGLWRDAKGSAVDGLEYQKRLRREW